MNEIIFVFVASVFWCLGFRIVVIKLIIDELMGIDFNASWNISPELSRGQKFFLKPLFACPYCMGSFHGTIIYFTFLPDNGFFWWPVFCICLTGALFMLKQFIYE